MHIVCPHCNFSRDVPDHRIPESARTVRCPRCGNRFPFSGSQDRISEKEPHPEPKEAANTGAAWEYPREEPAFPESGGDLPEWVRRERTGESGDSHIESPLSPEAGFEERVSVSQARMERPEPSFEEESGPGTFEGGPGDTEEAAFEPSDTSIPWENPEEGGVFRSLLRSIRGVLFSPRAFFERVHFTGTYGYPISFALLVGVVGFAAQVLWAFLYQPGIFNRAIQVLDPSLAMTTAAVLLLSAVLVPLLVLAILVWLYVKSLIFHACLWVLQGTGAPFQATFKVTAYSGAASLFLLIPVLGNLLALLWGTVVLIVGLSQVHAVGVGRSLLAVLLPFIITILLIPLFAVALHFIG